MTITQLTEYQALCVRDYKNYCLSLINKSKYTLKDITKEFDWDLWILAEALYVILNYEYGSEKNAFTNDEMNQWRDIFNDITNSTNFVDFNN